MNPVEKERSRRGECLRNLNYGYRQFVTLFADQNDNSVFDVAEPYEEKKNMKVDKDCVKKETKYMKEPGFLGHCSESASVGYDNGSPP